MASFESTRNMQNQEHFEVIEIDLPVITGACTIGGSPGFGTPLSCDEAYIGEIKTYKFTNQNAPIVPGALRYIKSISETTAEIKPGTGLGSRGTLSITFIDADKNDPNIGAPGVTDDVINTGTFFGKLSARQIIVNKEIRVKLYRVEADGTIDLAGGALTRFYIADTLKSNGKTWTLTGKDELSVADIDEKIWPPAQGGSLRLDIDDSVVVIPVDAATDYSTAQVVIIGDEFFEVNSVTGNQTGAAALNVSFRGTTILAPVSGVQLTRTETDSHSAGDEVFICRISDDERIDDLISDILTDSDVPLARIPTAAWATEIDTWHPTTVINTLWYKSESTNDVLKEILTDFLIDIVFDPEDRTINMFAISVWKESQATLIEGREINIDSVRIVPNESIRATRAVVLYDKSFLGRSDDTENYSKASRFTDPALQAPEFFGEHKDKLFDNSTLLSKASGDLLTQRWVSRFGLKPEDSTWTTPESKLNINVGQVVDYRVFDKQGFDGNPSSNARAQIVSIRPMYRDAGREYQIKVASYEAVALDNTEFVITGIVGNGLNLFTHAGNPPSIVTLTFVFDGATIRSNSNSIASIIAGNFVAGSKIILIFANSADGQAKGGDGGRGQSIFYSQELSQWLGPVSSFAGEDGGTVYDATGVDTDIYLSGATTSTNFPTALGSIRAPGGGGGGDDAQSVGTDDAVGVAGNGAGGGAGVDVGLAGTGGTSNDQGAPGKSEQNGGNGAAGDTVGNGGVSGGAGAGAGGDWGLPGIAGDKAAGVAGKGVVTGGAAVTMFGDNAGNFINGNGDAVL
jgi:hypothetical protein